MSYMTYAKPTQSTSLTTLSEEQAILVKDEDIAELKSRKLDSGAFNGLAASKSIIFASLDWNRKQAVNVEVMRQVLSLIA